MRHDSPTVLVTGGAGFIGSHLVESFQGRAFEIRVLDDLRTGDRRNLTALDHQFFEGSITDRDAVRQVMEGVDYVFHFAALVSVPESMSKPLQCQEVNVAGFITLLEEASRAGVQKVVLSSSAAIYGDNPTVPKVESMVPEPRSPYAISKLDGEYYGQLYHQEGRVGFTALRYFNVFGPRQNPRSAYAAAVPVFIERALRGDPLIVYGDGAQTRDFVFVRDVVSANAYAAVNSELSGVYNVGYGNAISIGDLAEKIIALTGSQSEIRYECSRAGDVRHSQASADRLREAGFRVEGSFEEGLRETIDWYRKELLG